MVRDDRPNILLIQADQMAAPVLPMYGGRVVKAPHMERLAAEGTVFENAYCNFPLCAPSRFSMLSGRFASRIQAFDNGAEFTAATPTLAHYLRYLGYRTCLSGKMHFIGPDQLHGFEERLTTDIYPADFIWTSEWDPGGSYSLIDPADPTPRGGMHAILDAGIRARTMQMDYDEESSFRSLRWMFDVARDDDPRPFFHVISFTHPHDPYTTTPEYWHRYDSAKIDPPRVPAPGPADRDPMTARLFDYFKIDESGVTAEHVMAARHAYYASISYVDDKVGELLACLHATGLDRNTIVVITSDHGEMLGERGLWYKRSFLEWSARVPLMMHAPGRIKSSRIAQNVSLVDLMPTFIDIGTRNEGMELAEPLDGNSVLPLLDGDGKDWPDTAISEILCEGTSAPAFMIKHGAYKYVHCDTDPPLLFDCAKDPDELVNIAGTDVGQRVVARLTLTLAKHCDRVKLAREIRESQRRRVFVQRAIKVGQQTPWDFEPPRDAAKQYFRGGVPYDSFFKKRDLTVRS